MLAVADFAQRTKFIHTLREWYTIQKLKPEKVAEIQQRRLKDLLLHATSTVPYYEKYSGHSRLSDFPVLKKGDIKDHFSDLISARFSDKYLIEEKSSGSSGVQGSVLMTKTESFDAIAHQTYLWGLSGYSPGDRLLQLGITPKRDGLKKLKDIFFRVNYQSSFNIDEREVVKTLQKYQHNKDAFFGGYASGLYEYARIAKKNGLEGVHFKAVISWGDKMFDHYRSLIETVFNTTVYDTYGCTEGLMIAGQCAQKKYHLLTPHLYVELLDEFNQEVNPGEWGRVVVTRLDAFAMPLIRYHLGDLAFKASPEEGCSCGLPFPLLGKIIGRDTDVVRTPSEKALIVHFFTGIFEHVPEIKQFRVVQDNLSSFFIEYISDLSDTDVKPVLERLRNEMSTKAKESLAVNFVRVNQIPPTASGKPQIISTKFKY